MIGSFNTPEFERNWSSWVFGGEWVYFTSRLTITGRRTSRMRRVCCSSLIYNSNKERRKSLFFHQIDFTKWELNKTLLIHLYVNFCDSCCYVNLFYSNSSSNGSYNKHSSLRFLIQNVISNKVICSHKLSSRMDNFEVLMFLKGYRIQLCNINSPWKKSIAYFHFKYYS